MPTPFDLMVAPNGARLQKTDHPAVPISNDEIVEAACRCERAGATSVHVHVREQKGLHSLDAARYGEVVRSLTERTKLRIQISTEAADIFDVAAQLRCLSEVPASDASVSLREISRAPELFEKLYATAVQREIDVQHILYSPEEVTELLRRFENGSIPEQNRRAIFVLGRYAADQQSDVADLSPFLKAKGNNNLNWSVCAFGRAEQECLMAALEEGGHARIGFENNRTAPNGSLFESNEASVAAFVERAARAGFRPAREII